MTKLDQQKHFAFYLSFNLTLDDNTEEFPFISGATLPMPDCNEDSVYVLPGDGSIKGFADTLGTNASQTAVELVLRQLEFKVICIP